MPLLNVDHFQQAAVAHLREPAAAELGGRRHAEYAECGEPVDDLARDIGLAIDARGVEMLVAKAFELRDGPFHIGPLGDWNLRIWEHPIGDEPALEQPLRHAGSLRQRPQYFLGLPQLRFVLGEMVRSLMVSVIS
jgi:hypothetical protein